MSENKADPLREALEDTLQHWEKIPMWNAKEVNASVERARAALAAPHPADDQDLVNMLWTWFEERGHDLREERTYGITSDEFRIMLDEHEANLLPDGHAPPQPAAPLGGQREEIAAWLIARDESLICEPVPATCMEWARGKLANGMRSKHSGDCTKESHSCQRCSADHALRDADGILAAIVEECAKVIEQYQERISETSNGSERSVSPRMHGNLMGLAYADAIRALAGKETWTDLKTDPELLALIERSKNYVMTPAEMYEQQRSFLRGQCPLRRDYKEWCAEVDRLLPPGAIAGKETDQ